MEYINEEDVKIMAQAIFDEFDEKEFDGWGEAKFSCIFCEAYSYKIKSYTHKKDCPVRIAKRILKRRE